MNTIELNDILKKHIDNFIGVFPSDKIPKIPRRRPVSLICNTDPSSKSGKHWVAFYFPNDDSAPIEFFDSYAVSLNDFISPEIVEPAFCLFC